tara:strand:- start:411 stop:1508 length:1098 start_codon:yes stop_codon:yes gene_type:complete
VIKPSSAFLFKRANVRSDNRVVLAAMTNKQSHADGTISQNEINWLVRRAKGSFGIITTAASHVSKDGQGWEGEFGLYDDKFIDRLSLLTRSIKHYDSLIFAQLFHGGMRSPEHLTGFQPISAGRTRCKESKSGYTRMASEDDIWRIIQEFTSAAVRCVDSGFDGIEIHGAHGYLISQFLSNTINNRTDRWGGDINDRSQFLFEIFNSIKNNVPKDFIVGIRLSPEIGELNISLEDSIELIKKVKTLGVDFIHLSCWDIYSPSLHYPKDPKRITEWITYSIDNLPPIISTGNIWSSEDAQNAMDQGADLVGVARVAIPYPDWAKNIEDTRYNPSKAPFSVQQLQDAQLSAPFINYMRKWKGFVDNE